MGGGGWWLAWSEIVTKDFKKLGSRAPSRSVFHCLYSHLIPFLTEQEINQVIISKLSKAKNTAKLSLISLEQYIVSFLEPIFAYLLTLFSNNFGGI